MLHGTYDVFTDLHVTLDGTATWHVLIVEASEAKPLSSGWRKTGRLGWYVVEVVVRCVHSICSWLVGWLVLWTGCIALTHRVVSHLHVTGCTAEVVLQGDC